MRHPNLDILKMFHLPKLKCVRQIKQNDLDTDESVMWNCVRVRACVSARVQMEYNVIECDQQKQNNVG